MVMILVVVGSISSSGCIRILQKNIDPSPAVHSPAVHDEKIPPSYQTPAASGPSSVIPTVETGSQTIGMSSANPADPIIPDENIRSVRNLSGKDGGVRPQLLQDSLATRIPLYRIKYSPRFNATAILVNVTRGPLVVSYTGSFAFEDPRISFATITIRDDVTKEVLAEEYISRVPEDGAGRNYDNDVNREHRIIIPSERRVHINIYGNQCEVDLSVYTGDSSSSTDGIHMQVLPEPVEYDVG